MIRIKSVAKMLQEGHSMHLKASLFMISVLVARIVKLQFAITRGYVSILQSYVLFLELKNLVDPASSHTFVFELKPCMQGASFLLTVKGSFPKTASARSLTSGYW